MQENANIYHVKLKNGIPSLEEQGKISDDLKKKFVKLDPSSKLFISFSEPGSEPVEITKL